MCLHKNLKIAAVLFIPAISVTSAKAQTELFGGELNANIAVVSDYRFRGVSKTDNGFAVQGSLDWYSDSGLYSGVWASNVDNFKGSDIETNFYLGLNKEINGFIYDAGITAYIYPGGVDANYIETYGSVGVDFGLLTSSFGIAYIFSGDNIGGQDNIYFYNETRGDIPDTPFSVNTHLGYEDGAFGNGKWDWKLGVSYSFDKFEVGVSYVDTNIVGKRSDSGVIFKVGAYF